MSDQLTELLRRFNSFEDRQRLDHDTITRMDERQRSESDEADHRHRNLTTAINGLASKSEHNALERRVSDVETTQRWLVRAAIAINTTILGGLAALGKKFGVLS